MLWTRDLMDKEQSDSTGTGISIFTATQSVVSAHLRSYIKYISHPLYKFITGCKAHKDTSETLNSKHIFDGQQLLRDLITNLLLNNAFRTWPRMCTSVYPNVANPYFQTFVANGGETQPPCKSELVDEKYTKHRLPWDSSTPGE